jgi:hypothetical protein
MTRCMIRAAPGRSMLLVTRRFHLSSTMAWLADPRPATVDDRSGGVAWRITFQRVTR